MARLAHAFAIESPLITADIVEASEFPALSQTYAVRGVPKTVITPVSQSQIAGGIPGVQFVGAVPEQEFVEKVLEVGIKEAGTAGASP